jgi:phosphoglycolate phosphatase
MSALTAVFDLDGTLVDTAADLVGAINRTTATLGLASIPLADLRPKISRGARVLIETALSAHGLTKPEAEVDALLASFLVDYGNNLAVQSKAYPHAIDVLERLRQAGHRIAVCTNKREKLARKLLAALKMDGLFHAVTGSDTLPVHKPDPGHLIGTVILADGDLGRSVMIGDSEVDIATAQSAGMPSIGVSFGYSPVPIVTLKPTAVIDGFDQLEAVLANLFPPSPKRRGG